MKNIRIFIALCIGVIFLTITGYNNFNQTVSKDNAGAIIELDSQNFFYVIDCGHGYKPDYFCGYKSVVEESGSCFWEYEFNWGVGDVIADKLDSLGIKYLRTAEYRYVEEGKIAYDLDLDVRVNLINAIKTSKPIILFSIHANASSDPQVSGFEVFTPHKALGDSPYSDKKVFSDSIASMLMRNIKKTFPDHNMRTKSKSEYKEAHYSIISQTNCYAVLSENEFFTNPEMRKKMKSKKFKNKVANAHIKTILEIEKK